MHYDLIIIHLVIAYAHGLHCKHHTRMTMNKFHFNELKQDKWKCDWLIGHVIYITTSMSWHTNSRNFHMLWRALDETRVHRAGEWVFQKKLPYKSINGHP